MSIKDICIDDSCFYENNGNGYEKYVTTLKLMVQELDCDGGGTESVIFMILSSKDGKDKLSLTIGADNAVLVQKFIDKYLKQKKANLHF